MSGRETAITTIAQSEPIRVTVGVDTHGDVHVAYATDQLGRHLATTRIATTPRGYRALLDWARGLGQVAAFGVEGTGCYGAGLARFLGSQGQVVVEVTGRTAKPAAGGASLTRSMPRPLPERCWPARRPLSPRPVTAWSRWCGACGWPEPRR